MKEKNMYLVGFKNSCLYGTDAAGSWVDPFLSLEAVKEEKKLIIKANEGGSLFSEDDVIIYKVVPYIVKRGK